MIKDHRAQGESLNHDLAQRQTVKKNISRKIIIYSAPTDVKVNKPKPWTQPPSSVQLINRIS